MADREDEEKKPAGNGAAEAGGSEAAAGAATEGSQDGTAGDDPVDEVAALKAELDETKDRLLRERAELENYKKRMAREKADAVRYGSETLLRELLPVIDNLERAAEQLRTLEGGDAVAEGVDMVHRGFVDTLGRHGVKIVEAHGSAFDPALHEAIAHVESEAPANTVVDEHQRGYAFHDRLLRPALVTVGKGPATPPDANSPVEKPGDDG